MCTGKAVVWGFQTRSYKHRRGSEHINIARDPSSFSESQYTEKTQQLEGTH